MTLWILKPFDLTMSNFFFVSSVCSLSWHVLWTALCLLLLPSFNTCLFWLLHIHLKWFNFHALNNSCHRLDTFVAYVHSHQICNCSMCLFCLWYCSFPHSVSQHCILYCLLLPHINCLWAFFTSTQDNTSSLVILNMLLVAGNSLIISVIISLSFMPLQIFWLIYAAKQWMMFNISQIHWLKFKK